MNYIHRLKADVEHRDAAISAAKEEIDNFTVFLHSSKFTGVDLDGSRKDWISTGDVVRRLANLRYILDT